MRHPHIHILGHPFLPADLTLHPENGQLRAAILFARLLSLTGFTWSYYGIGEEFPSLPLEDKGEFISILSSQPITTSLEWKVRGSLHNRYNKKLKEALDDGIRQRLDQPQIIASLHGMTQADSLPEIATEMKIPLCEPMMGYNCCWTPARVFPSRAQQNVIYATLPQCWDTQEKDRVIPHFLFPEDFAQSLPSSSTPKPYLLYLGRNVSEKGIETARITARELGIPLKIVTQGCHGRKKLQLLTQALAVLMPTQYAEPFGYVAIESLFCGTPVIASDWGSFPEIIHPGKNGYLCRSQQEFTQAIRKLLNTHLDSAKIKMDAINRFSAKAVAHRYQEWLLSLLK